MFRGFSQPLAGIHTAVYRMLWHRDQRFDLRLNTKSGLLKFLQVLPGVPAKSSMYREFREFLVAGSSGDLPAHRRIDPAKVQLRASNRAGSVALTAQVLDGDYEYAVRKLIGLVHEIYMVFLYDGKYYPYMIEQFDLDPDKM